MNNNRSAHHNNNDDDDDNNHNNHNHYNNHNNNHNNNSERLEDAEGHSDERSVRSDRLAATCVHAHLPCKEGDARRSGSKDVVSTRK